MKFVVKFIILFFCIFGGYFSAIAIYFISTPYVINLGKIHPSITSDEYNNLYLSSFENYGVLFQKKLNTSTSLTTPQEVMHFHNYYSVDINIVIDINNKIYITGGNTTLIFMTTSSDRGDTWSPPIPLIDFGKIANSAHDMTVDSQGHSALIYNNESIVFIMNSTDGVTWSAPRELGSFLKFSIDFDMADNLVLVASTDGSSLINMSSGDYGYSWSLPGNITTDITLVDQPILRIDRYNIFHVWFLNGYPYPSSSRDLIHERAFNGSTWSSTIEIQRPHAYYGFGATLNSVNNSVIVWCEGKTYFFMSFDYFMYAQGLPENYFTVFYMIPFFIGLAIVAGIYWGIFIILYVRMRRNVRV